MYSKFKKLDENQEIERIVMNRVLAPVRRVPFIIMFKRP